MILIPCLPGRIFTEISGSSPCDEASEDGVVVEDAVLSKVTEGEGTEPVGRREGALGRRLVVVLPLARAEVLASGCFLLALMLGMLGKYNVKELSAEITAKHATSKQCDTGRRRK